MPLRKSKKSLKEKAFDNARVTIGTSKEQETLKEGIPCEHSKKHLTEAPIVGVSVGVTKNMDNYESLRADVWLTDNVHEGYETVNQAYERVSKIVEDTLTKIIEEYI